MPTPSESRNLTALCGVRLTADEFARGTEHAKTIGMTLPALLRSLLLDVLGGPHVYLSTACRHADDPGREGEDLHGRCQTDTRRYDGTHKIAAQCKDCGAPCICTCHQEATDV